MVRKVDVGTIIILDIGRSACERPEGQAKSFFEEARECASRVIERKILSQEKSFLGVLLLGSKSTKNKMAENCPGVFRHIDLLYELQEPTWNMIRNLPKQGSTSRADWLDALAVAAEHLMTGVSGVSIAQRKIILMTNFATPTSHSEDNFQQMLKGLKADNFEVDVIGTDISDDTLKSEDVVLARHLVSATNGTTASFEDIMRYLLFHRKKAVAASPWNVDLSIGPNIKIPVSAYIKLKDEPIVKNWQKAVKDLVTSSASTVEGIYREKVHINVENQTVVEPSEVIKGISYGQSIIPFSKCDDAMLYKSGDKCLSVYGFTHATNITWQNLTGDSLYYVFGRKGDEKAQTAVRCLVECLHELNLVGIVRKVHNKNNAPKMFALMPVIDTNNYICLAMAAVCYKEEIKNMAFPPTNSKKYACSNQQVSAFKDLIKAMDLMKAYDDMYDDSEAFPVAETVSPSAQYVLDCIAYRALNPGKPLPAPKQDIMMLFDIPPLVLDRAREPLEKIKSLFPLKEVEVKTRSKKNPAQNDATNTDPSTSGQSDRNGGADRHEIPFVQVPVAKKTDQVVRIGTLDPVSDFKTLCGEGKTIAELSPQMADAIESLVYCNLDGNYAKAFTAMKFFRDECVKHGPSHYNDWLNIFKCALTERKKYDVLTLIREKKLSVIVKDENKESSYEIDIDEDSQLYEEDTQPNTGQLTIRSDINAMYDDL